MKYLKRFMAGVLAMLTMFMSLFTNSLTALAASPTSNLTFQKASVRKHEAISEFGSQYSGNISYAMIDGHSAYCMNHGLKANTGQEMTSGNTPATSMTEQQEKLLAYCMYYGFSSTETGGLSDSQKNEYIATQATVWIIMEGIFGTEAADSAASKLCACAPDGDASYRYYEDLRDNIQLSYYAVRPSFSNKMEYASEVYELEWNEANQRYEGDFYDYNGVLENFDFWLDGYQIEKNGNSMTIYTDTVNTNVTTGLFESTNGTVETTTSCVFWLTGNDGYQEFVSEQPTADPIYAYMRVKTEEIGYGELTKTDEASGVQLAGAVYGIYSDNSCTNLVNTMTTDANGYAKSGALSAGTYYVREITAPSGYVWSDKVHTLTVLAGQTTGISANDKEQLGSLTIYKEGEVLTGWNGSNFVYEVRKLPGAAFTVTAGADIYKADGTLVHHRGDVIREGLVTGSDGMVVLTDLHLGTYVVTETKSIAGYTINTTPQTVVIAYKNQNVSVQAESSTIRNERQKAAVLVVKNDSDTKNPLAGGQYTLYTGNDIVNYDGTVIVAEGTALETVTTQADGTAAYSVDLPIGNSFSISETKAPENYFRNSDDVYHFSFEVMPENEAVSRFEHIFENDRTTAKIRIFKVDKEKKQAMPQGDATLAGAVYGLYASEDIVHPDRITGVIYHAGDLVDTLTTDEHGECSIDNLYLGKYFVKELQPSEGYLLDEAEYDLFCDYEGDFVPEVIREEVSEEQVIKQPFQLIKVSETADETEAPVLSGAGFTAFLKSSLGVKEDGSLDFDNADPVIIGENGTTTIYTDDKGYTKSIAIPYGTYVVLETVTPHNMETIKPFEVKITENHPEEPQIWRVFLDREFSAKLRIVKKDSDTKQTVLVANTEFKIFNLDTMEYVTMITTYPSKVAHSYFYTDEDGDLILPEVLKVGNYRIEEVAAPFGYAVNEDYVTVAVDSNTVYETDPDTFEAVITVEYEDVPVTGELTVEKRGEALVSYKGGLFASAEDKAFQYEERSLAGAKFEVYAAEDIYTKDLQKDMDGNRTKYYAEGDLVAELVTGEDGKAVLKDIPLGKYRVVETEAPFGYVLNRKEQYVSFVYVDDRTPVIHEGLTFTNDRQKVSLSVEKKDKETTKPIAGAVFGLYAAEDIVNADGSVIVEAGTLLEKALSDENGKIVFVKDYPFAEYSAKELSAPAGYVSSEAVVLFDAEYKGQDTPVAEYTKEFLNTPTTFEFSKEDITNGAELSGATLSVIDKDQNVVETWTSKAGEKHVIKRLVVGETYTLREETAPYGYLKEADISFTVEDTENIQSVVMKDEVPTGAIIVNKDGEFITDKDSMNGHWYDFVFNYFKKSLAGVTFEVYAKEDIVSPDGLDTVYYKADELVETIVTDDRGIATLEKLPLGKYYLVETKTIEGFVLDSAPIMADLSYVDQNTSVVYVGMTVTNERQKVQITVVKKDEETKEPLAGAVFGLFAKEDILNADGKVVVAADERIEREVTGTDGSVAFVSDLPLGKYYVKEVEAPKGYVKSEKTVEVDAVFNENGGKMLEFTAEFTNVPIKVEISKTDITGEKELGGAVLSILDKDGNLVEKWTSETGKSHMIERMPVGEYLLREETAPYGYLIANEVLFEVTEMAEIQKVTMKDDAVAGKIVLEKTDEYTKKPIAGVEFEIRDESGNVIETLVTDQNGHAESAELSICHYNADGSCGGDIHYYVVETKAAEGYLLDETVYEVVLSYDGNAVENVVYTLNVTNKPKEPGLPQTGGNYSPWAWIGAGIGTLTLGLIAAFLEKRTLGKRLKKQR